MSKRNEFNFPCLPSQRFRTTSRPIRGGPHHLAHVYTAWCTINQGNQRTVRPIILSAVFWHHRQHEDVLFSFFLFFSFTAPEEHCLTNRHSVRNFFWYLVRGKTERKQFFSSARDSALLAENVAKKNRQMKTLELTIWWPKHPSPDVGTNDAQRSQLHQPVPPLRWLCVCVIPKFFNECEHII